MAPKRNLDELLGELSPELRDGRWVFVAVADEPPSGLVSVASIVEPEGQTLVIAEDDAVRLGLWFGFVASCIVCRRPSSLDAAGLVAAVLGALSNSEIACNVIAGANHDYLFVPFERREEAIDVLVELAERSRRSRVIRAPRPEGVEQVAIRDGSIRLGQFLKLAGFADSGAAAKPLLAFDRVRVNGKNETRRGRQLVAGDVVTVDGRSVEVG